MNTKWFSGCALLLAVASAQAGTVAVQNMATDELSAYGLFDSGGSLLGQQLTGNIRLGTFAGGMDVTSVWNSGDIAALDAGFSQFGSAGNMFGAEGMDGVFSDSFSSSDSFFGGLPVFLWISTSADFLGASSEHLIFRFDANFEDALVSLIRLQLSPSAGQLLVGEYGNFSHDYQAGGAALPGFNLVPAVPEPSTYAALLAVAGGAVALLRRRSRCSAV